MSDVWSKIHADYKEQDWIKKPSIFAEQVIKYFPQTGRILDLGAGQGQDSRFFAKQGYRVVSTDISESALKLNRSKITGNLKDKITVQELDLSAEFPFKDGSFDVIYAHLSFHYFDKDTTLNIFNEIRRVLRTGGILAFLVNSVSDPEYKEGSEIEKDFFKVDKVTKRYFSVESTRDFIEGFDTILLDDLGETYKDNAKGVHNLIRFIGKK